jgi:hypothetical protein
MTGLIVLSLGEAMWSIRRSLEPLKGAADQADTLSAKQFEARLDAADGRDAAHSRSPAHDLEQSEDP